MCVCMYVCMYVRMRAIRSVHVDTAETRSENRPHRITQGTNVRMDSVYDSVDASGENHELFVRTYLHTCQRTQRDDRRSYDTIRLL